MDWRDATEKSCFPITSPKPASRIAISTTSLRLAPSPPKSRKRSKCPIRGGEASTAASSLLSGPTVSPGLEAVRGRFMARRSAEEPASMGARRLPALGERMWGTSCDGTPGTTPEGERGRAHGHENHESDEELRPVGRDPHQNKTVLHHGEECQPQQRAEHRSDAAVEARSAEDHRRQH